MSRPARRGVLAAGGPVLPEPGLAPGTVRETAREVLSRPMFAQEVGWLDRLRDRALALAGDLLARLLGAGGIDWVAWGVVLAVVLLAVVAAIRLARRTRPDPGRTVRRPGPEPGRTRRQWRRLADEHARAGRWREAVRARYHELITALVDGGRLEERPARTVGELRSALTTDDATVRRGFEGASRLFEAVWYADEPASPVTVRALDEHLASLDDRMST